MNCIIKCNAIVLLLISSSTGWAANSLQLAGIFSDHVVLQRNLPVQIWGTSLPNETVTVQFSEQALSTTSDASGNWIVKLNPISAMNVGQTLTVSSEAQSIKIIDVLVGDVWHASGQSNMAMTVSSVVKKLPEADQELGGSEFPEIRFRRIEEKASQRVKKDIPAAKGWFVCTPNSVKQFSAASFFFAKKLHKQLEVPIGIIDSSRGGTPIEPFVPRQAFKSHPTLLQELELSDKHDLEGLTKMVGGVRARNENWLASYLFNSRIAPITKFQTRGMIWYQGESNCGLGEDPRDYQYKMKALIEGWRKELNNPEMPCYFVQLPGSGARANWPYMREQQRFSAALSNTAMVVTIDLLDTDIHPPNKIDVGYRLANCALANEYQHNIPHSGPLFKNAVRKGESMIVTFDHAKSGLMIAKKEGLSPPKELPQGTLYHFELLNISGTWVPASAKIAGSKLIVTSKYATKPYAVRYAYEIDPQKCYLYNRDGLPASPFCSDWKIMNFEPEPFEK